ncbi:site-specific integrase [Corynebacterium aurimucosum]|uniref:site-specific integrase n=1 Tax=Corynebacterium aurimucosum TaxID=169292 RepID=UPI00187A1CD7|nr:tyrosine-type recombinase/integrase [Corynebacterium aurimucosum]MBE7363926.1 site-specific integrase [Corynebacterium aurimucosum]
MASFSQYETASGKKKWLVQYRTPDRKLTKKRGFKTKRDAERFAANVEVTKSDGTFINPAAGRARVSEVYKTWLPSQDALAARTKASNLSVWRVHVEPKWGSWSVSQITTPEIRKWVADLQDQEHSWVSIKRSLHVLRSVLNTAVEARMLAVNPVVNVKVKRKAVPDRVFLTPSQVGQLAEAMPEGQYQTLVYVLAYCGLRISELAALTVSDWRPDTNRLNISKALKGPGIVGPTKTYETRLVPVPGFLGLKLNALVSGQPGSAPLFTSPTGAQLNVDNYRKRIFIPGLEAAQKDGEFPDVRPHGLRHTCASMAINSGANVKAVQRLLGHESAAVTLDVYSDLFPDSLDDVAESLHNLYIRSQNVATEPAAA